MKNAILYLLTFCFYLQSSLNAQAFEWVKQMGGTGSNVAGKKIMTDKWGNVLTLGTYSGTVDFDPGPASYTLNSLSSGSGAKTFLSKLDSSGNFLWAEQLAGGTDLTADKYGNIFVLGNCTGTVDIDPGVGTYTLVNIYSSVFILKLNPAGNFIFAKSFLNEGGQCIGNSILLDSQQNIYTLGSFAAGPIDFDPGISTFTMATPYVEYPSGSSFTCDRFLSKLDSNGVFVYAKNIWSAFDSGNLKAAINKNDEIIFMDGHPAYSVFRPEDAVIEKFNANGIAIWYRSRPYYPVISICTDLSNNICIVGAAYTATTDVDPGPGTFSVNSSLGANATTFILQLNNAGNFNWAKSINIDIGSNLSASKNITDNSDNQYVSGTFAGTVDVDPGDGMY